MNNHGNYELLIEKINTFIKRYYLNSLLRGLIFLGAGVFSAYIVITLSEYFGNFDSTFRTVLFYGFILLNLGLVAWLVIPPLMAWLKLGKTLTHDQAADIIGKHFNDVNDKLLNTLQLKKLSAEDGRHRDLIEASIDQKIENLRPIRFPSAINLRENRRYLKWVLVPAAVIIVLAFAAPSMLTESTKRLIRHDEYFAPVAPFKFVVLNKTLSVVQGDDLNLELKLEGDKFPADVYIEMENNTFKLDKESVSRFKYQFSNVQESTKFRLVGNGFNSVPYEVKVNPRPALLHFDVVLTYPAYLKKQQETLSNAGDITVPEGTTVTWKFHTRNATGVAFSLGEKHEMLRPSGNDLFSHSERILSNTIYKLNPVNQVVNTTDSAAYRISAIADEAPAIDVMERPDSVSMKAFYFTGKIQDDHGFSGLTFHYKISPGGSKANEKSFVKPVKADLGINISDFFYYWNLKELGIKPGDQVSYFFEVADNDGVNGPKKVQSPERSINVPDAAQLEQQLNAGTEQVRKNIQAAAKMAEEIERESQKMNEMLLSKNSLSFDEQKQLDALMQKRRELDDLVKQIQADNKKNMYNRRENQQQNGQLAEEQKQIEKLLDNVLDPKTRELLDKLQELAQNNQKQGTRDQLQKMQMDNRTLKREFNRLNELYKKMAFDQKVNQNINKLNQLAEKQEKLADETKKPVDPKAQEQQKAQDDKARQDAMKQAAEQLKKALLDAQKQAAELEKINDQKQGQNQAQQEAQKQTEDQLKKALQDAQKQADELQKKAQQQAQQQAQNQQQKAQQDAAQKQAAEQLKKDLQNAQKQTDEVQKQAEQQGQQQQNQQQKAQNDAQKDAADKLEKAIQEAQKQAEELQKQQQGQDQNDQKSSGDQQTKDQQQSGAEQQKSAQEQKQQDKLNEEFKDIKKDLEELAKEAEKIQSRQDFENPKNEQESIQDKMEQSSQQLQKSNRSKASQSQQQAAQQMKQMAQKMQQQQQQEEEEENSVNMKQIRELLKSLVNSSFRQEKVMEQLKSTSTLDPNYVTLAQTQKNIKDNLKTAEDSLYAISKRVPQIEATVNREISAINERIDQALESLGDRRTAEANRSQQYAMTAMNNLALMLSDALNNMQAQMNNQQQSNSQSRKQSRSQRMQQLSRQQQQLNQNMQRAREQMQQQQQQQQQQGNRSQQQQQQQQMRGMSEQLARMAREQQMIRQAMQQLNNEDRKDGGTGIKDLDKISQQMEQTENDIVNRRITEEALKRQEQIRIRMLEAEKAAQEQEQEQQREGHAGKDMPPGYIKALQDYQQVKEKQTEQIRTVPPALNLYYKKKIKTYFDQLNIK
ncbi:DUF4175 family protein [Mucilaginibacter auburnensis]|uniref:DUF4175 family protein n=1 Tax=Mucilaginibacter auburnensis TaxID=1457233 RepID=A0A2H9VRC8_9SPHI|nr:DUF4175 family protein [Mucilaginibacter auburnensis]PJJ83380.1 hypothetical protein CLV57_0361 [Mucilaginibacter auburnensis]